MGRAVRIWVILFALALLAGEVLLRVAIDFPVFRADNEVGYYPAPRQRGSYLFINDWAFNAHGMGVAEEFSPSDRRDVLLVGDSVVYGGNPVRQADKLGPMLEQSTGWQVWPISAGSWALQNELAYLERTSEAVLGADAIVFVLNSEDFGEPSSWTSEYTHPRSRPPLMLAYLMGKFLLGATEPSPKKLAVPRRNLETAWRAFRTKAQAPITVIGIPKKVERDCSWMPEWIGPHACAQLERSDYRDSIHPLPSGNRKLAEMIAG